MSETYDAIIVGSGAGGAAAAFRLAEAGRRILVLEKVPMKGSAQTDPIDAPRIVGAA